MEKINTFKSAPQNIEAEKALLGSIIIRPNSLVNIIEMVDENSFFDKKNKLIFSAIKELFNDNEPIDLVSLAEKMKSNKTLTACGGISYINDVSTTVPNAINIEAYAKIVQDKSQRRVAIEIADSLSAYSFDEDTEMVDTIGSAISSLTKSITVKNGTETADASLSNLYNNIDKFVESGNKFYGAETGIIDLDYQLDGIQGGHFGVITGYTSVGKTSFMLNLVLSFLKQGKKVVFFSLEMSPQEIMLKLLSLVSGVTPFDIKRGKLPRDSEHYKFLQKARLVIYTDSNWANINMTMIKEAVNDKADIFFLDYIGLLQVPNAKSDYSALASISKELQNNLQRFGIPMIALSQISNDQARNDNPNLISTKGAGDIAASADFVIRLKNKEENNDHLNEMKANGVPLPIQCLIQKYRHGATGSINLWFDIKTGIFLDKNTYDEDKYADMIENIKGDQHEDVLTYRLRKF